MKYLALFITLILFSCSKDSPGSVAIDTQIEVFLEDANGNNLLLESTSGAIDFNEITMYYVINGENQIVNNSLLDCPKSICLNSEMGKTWVTVLPNDRVEDEYPITYIDWGNGDIDTLKCHFLRNDNGRHSSIICDKVWYNDSLLFPTHAIPEMGRAFKIVK